LFAGGQEVPENLSDADDFETHDMIILNGRARLCGAVTYPGILKSIKNA
jgi:hypothetical protein